MMLEWLAEPACVLAAARIRGAVARVFANPAARTADLGGRLSTREMTDEILAAL